MKDNKAVEENKAMKEDRVVEENKVMKGNKAIEENKSMDQSKTTEEKEPLIQIRPRTEMKLRRESSGNSCSCSFSPYYSALFSNSFITRRMP